MNETDKRILVERARALAKKPVRDGDEKNLMPVVSFVLHPELYAVESSYVKEAFSMSKLTPLPGTPPFVMGIVNYRGAVVSAVNLKKLFGLSEMGLTEFNKILVVSDGLVTMGIVADAIEGNIAIEPGKLTSPPGTLSENARELFRGITSGGLILLDVGKMLQSPRILVDQ